MADLALAHLKAVNGFLGKSDGKDKLTALIQYACMFISAGEPGNVRKIQASVTAARKVFRVLRPFESLMPIIQNPHLDPNKPLPLELAAKLKNILMAIYFAGDHVVWAGQAGIIANKDTVARYQKVSLYSWAGGSLCTVFSECYELLRVSKLQRKGESDAEWTARRAAAVDEVNRRLLVLFHAVVQAALAVGLLQIFAWKPRTVGFLGVLASAINCYMLLPPALLAPKPAGPVVQAKHAAQAAAKQAQLKAA